MSLPHGTDLSTLLNQMAGIASKNDAIMFRLDSIEQQVSSLRDDSMVMEAITNDRLVMSEAMRELRTNMDELMKRFPKPSKLVPDNSKIMEAIQAEQLKMTDTVKDMRTSIDEVSSRLPSVRKPAPEPEKFPLKVVIRDSVDTLAPFSPAGLLDHVRRLNGGFEDTESVTWYNNGPLVARK